MPDYNGGPMVYTMSIDNTYFVYLFVYLFKEIGISLPIEG